MYNSSHRYYSGHKTVPAQFCPFMARIKIPVPLGADITGSIFK